MPIGFGNPALLFGAFAAAVPVIIHFLSRRRARRVAFSDQRFLQQEETQQARRRGIRRWLLLLLRVLALLCVVLAASRPFWGGLATGASGSRTVLFVLDASASMQTQEEDGTTRFVQARDLAGEMMAGLGSGAVVQAVALGAEARPVFAAWLPAGESARQALQVAEPTDGPCDLAAGLREAARLVATAPSTPVEIVLLSDLQAVTWPDLEDAAVRLRNVGEARLLVRPIGGEIPGGGVLGVHLPERALRPGETAEISALVRAERAGQPFWLELDGRRVAEDLAPTPGAGGEPVNVRFPVSLPRAGRYTGTVRKESDRLPVDDARPFVLEVPVSLDVVLAHGEDRDGLGRGGWRYLQRALAPTLAGESAGEGLFTVRPMVADRLTDGDLAGVDALILVDPGVLGRRSVASVRSWLAEGGALLLVVGDPTQAAYLEETLLPLVGLPGAVSFVARDGAAAERAQPIDPGHAVLSGLGEDGLVTLGEVEWQRYFALLEGPTRVLLTASSGAPLLLEGDVDNGRFAILPFHLRREATDLALSPVFLPLVQRLVAWLAWHGGPRASGSVTVGETPGLRLARGRLRLAPGADASDLVVHRPEGAGNVPATLAWQGEAPVVTAPGSRRAGLYTFLAGADTLGLVAAAVPAEESGVAVRTPEQFRGLLADAGWERTWNLGDAGADGLGRMLAGVDLAPWLLAAAVALLLTELAVGRRV